MTPYPDKAMDPIALDDARDPGEPQGELSPRGDRATVRPGAATTMPSRSVSIDYLRAFVIFLVVAFHSALAYLPYAPAPAEHFVGRLEAWRAFPVMDGQRSAAAGIFFLINNTFFMTLMFFVSGLFVWRSLERKGGVSFLRDRLLRLGVPFLFGALVIPPIAHFALICKRLTRRRSGLIGEHGGP
jgi:peptidoglycan/LPS O-acetylase OafA/YrhL